MSSTLESVLSILGIFFRNNPTINEVESILPNVVTAISSAKAGQPFSVSFPERVAGVAGTSTFSWAPAGPHVV